MSKETNDVDIRKLYDQMKDELRSVVYIAVAVGGAFGACASLAITGLSDTSRLVLVFLGIVFGFHLGKLRKQDLYEKSLLLYYFMDLLPKTTAEEPKDVVEETPAPVEATATDAATETKVEEAKTTQEVTPEATPVVAAEETKTEVAPVPPTSEPTKPEVKTVVKKARGKPVKLSSN